MNANVTSLPFTRNREDVPALWFVDVLWFVLVSGEDTNGAYSIVEQFMSVGTGPPPHVHPFEDEMFFVMAGELTLVVDGKKLVLGPGRMGHVPRNTVHEFKVTGTETCHCLNYYTPAGFEQAILGCARFADRPELPPPGLDPPNSPKVLQFFNNYWIAPTTLPWAVQKHTRGE